MTNIRAAATAALTLVCVVLAGSLAVTNAAKADWNAPWKSDDKALVIDAYEFNPIDWTALTADKRIAGFISKASDGLAPEWNCSNLSGDEEKLCKNRWWKYSVTKELYLTRRQMAKMKGLEWGAYHLGRPGNPREQADHFVDFAEPEADDLIALDIEDRTDDWMSLSDAEIFANQIKIRVGRYPVLYTNGSTAKYISQHSADYPLLSRLPLWYARYREDITDKFPSDTWPTYALWQFSSMHNCNSHSCPYRVKGTKSDIDVNVSTMDVAGLKAAWPFDKLIDAPAKTDPALLVASISDDTKSAVASAAKVGQNGVGEDANRKVAPTDEAATPVAGTLAAAYGPSGGAHVVDPLKLLTAVARQEKAEAAKADTRPNAATTEHSTQLASLTPSDAAQSGTAPAGVAKTQDEPAASLSAPLSALAPEAAAKLSVHLVNFKDAALKAASRIDELFIGHAEAATRTDFGTSSVNGLRRGHEGASGKDGTRDELSSLDGQTRSRFAAMLKSAEAESQARALPMPAKVLTQLAPGESVAGTERGPRLSGERADNPRYADLDVTGRRILVAFDATR